MGKKRKKSRKKSSANKKKMDVQLKNQPEKEKTPEVTVRSVIPETVVLPQSLNQEKKRKSWKKGAAIAGGCVAGILAVSYISGMIYLKDKFLMNTTINGIDISYNTIEEAEAKIAQNTKEYRIQLEERDGDQEVITAEEVGYQYVSKGEIEGFKEQQPLALWPASIWKESSYTFEVSTEYDTKKFEDTVSSLKCFDKDVAVAPTNAYMTLEDTLYEIIPETQGKKVRKKKLIKVLGEAIRQSETSLSLEETQCYAKPKVTEEDELLNKTVKNLNRFARTRIVYKFGEEEEILDGSIISKWLSYDEEGEVTLEEEKVALYVAYLAQRYDTYERPRDLVTHDGTTVTVEGGRYGWLIDQAEETAELLKRIKNGGKVNERLPVYAQTAVSRENSDLGHDYIEIDLTNQHLWMYIDGKEIVSTDIVSGTYVNSSRRTPGGTYTIYYKKSPAVLRSNTPGDSYESPVTYWMPFNGGIGLHDANWRGSFGGSIFQYSGSHGCVNLPTSAAKDIYNNTETGMPVILYYR